MSSSKASTFPLLATKRPKTSLLLRIGLASCGVTLAVLVILALSAIFGNVNGRGFLHVSAETTESDHGDVTTTESTQSHTVSYSPNVNSQSEYIIIPSDRSSVVREWKNEQERLQHRFRGASFATSLRIFNSTITCDQELPVEEEENLYFIPTWTCYNIRVEGRRLPYAYIPDPEDEHIKRSRRSGITEDAEANTAMRTERCGDVEIIHNNRQLCAKLLQTLNINTTVTQVQIPRSSCEPSPTGRALLREKVLEKPTTRWSNPTPTSGIWEWYFNDTGSGFALDLRCSTELFT